MEFARDLADGSQLSDTTDDSEDENQKLRKELERLISLIHEANDIIHRLKKHRDDLLESIRWHRDMIQLPTRPDKRLWRNTIVRWDKDNR